LALTVLATPRSPGQQEAPSAPAPLADQLVTALEQFGITTYFGVPGGAIEPLFNALARRQAAGQVRVVPMRSEAGAGFAADGYFRATGRMAACTCTTGPGIANLMTSIMSAAADRIPILVLTPQVALRKQGRGALQDSSEDGHDLVRMLAGCTRYSSAVTHPEQLAHKVSRAIATALSAPMGPVHLSIPSDLLAASSSSSIMRLAPGLPRIEPVDTGAVAALLRDLFGATVPVLYVGDDAGLGAYRLPDLAQALGASIVSSPAGKRWIGHLDPAYKGVLGFSGHAAAAEAVHRADLVVAFGATFDELSTNAWSVFPEVPIYSVDRHALHTHRLPGLRPVIADGTHVIAAILERLPYAEEEEERTRRYLLPTVLAGASDATVHPADLMKWLSQSLPPDVVVHVDAGNSFSWSTRHLLRPRADTYRVSMGLSAMCWGISAVIGETVARGRRTLCITGDGSMLMSGLELTVAVEHKLPVTYIILNDSSLGMVRHGQRLAGAESIAHEIAPVRFDRVAEACGARGMRVERLGDLAQVPSAWIDDDRGGPCVIDVRIDRDAVPPIGDRVQGLAVGISR
jgi:acetolactate synthase-1/2/3 large subunit